jgi:hypothetical protein
LDVSAALLAPSRTSVTPSRNSIHAIALYRHPHAQMNDTWVAMRREIFLSAVAFSFAPQQLQRQGFIFA